MVIKGEKSPAFSATTLTIPASQANFMQHIVDSSRRKYARDRTEVEQEIQSLISTQTAPSAQPKPQSQSLAKKWPVDAGAKPVRAKEEGSETKISHDKPAAPSPDAPPKKRTRSRSRKKKPTESAEPNRPRIIREGSEAPRPKAQPKEEEIRLR